MTIFLHNNASERAALEQVFSPLEITDKVKPNRD